jgi:hypothetical protein
MSRGVMPLLECCLEEKLNATKTLLSRALLKTTCPATELMIVMLLNGSV